MRELSYIENKQGLVQSFAGDYAACCCARRHWWCYDEDTIDKAASVQFTTPLTLQALPGKRASLMHQYRCSARGVTLSKDSANEDSGTASSLTPASIAGSRKKTRSTFEGEIGWPIRGATIP